MTQTLALGMDVAGARRAFRGRRRGWLHRVFRWAVMGLGGLLVLLGVLIAPLPGPFGLPVSVVGLVLILRNSYWAKRQFIRAQQAQPRYVYPFRRLMRRKPEFLPVFWQQALRMERLLLRRGGRVLVRARRTLKTTLRRRPA